MFNIDARSMLTMSYEELVAIPHQLVNIRFDDGELLTGWRATIYSWYMWRYHAVYPTTPLLIKHHIGNKRLTRDTHVKTMTKCLWSAFDASNGTLDVEVLCKMAYDITNDMFNDSEYVEEWITTLSADDFIEILDHPKIKELNDNTQENAISIGATYKGITAILKDEHELSDNRLANAVKSNLVKLGQALQCVGPRGYLTDLDSHRFDKPVMGSYGGGIYDLYGSGVESRSGAKSLVYNKELIKDTEYFNREMQLLGQTILGLIDGDCGTTRTLPKVIQDANDLRNLDGKYYVTENGLRTISGADIHLIGQKVQLRAVSLCETPHRGYLCKTCYGDLSLSIPRGTNPGHVSTTEVGRSITQKVLSNKHLDQSSMIEAIVLDNHDKQFLKVMRNGAKLGLADGLHGLPVSITFPRECTPYLADINSVEEIAEHSLPRYSQINSVVMNVLRKGGIMESAGVNVSVSSRIGYFTAPFLKHIKTVGWTITSNGDYEVTLNGWDVARPIFALPMKQMNMLDFKKEVEGMIKRSKKFPAGKGSPDLSNPQVLSDEICALYDLLNKRIGANFVHVEVIMHATLIVSEEGRDYRIPHPWEHREFGRFTDILKFRSMSAALAYEKQVDALNNPVSYLIKQRMSHTYDAVLRC
jgi:hypothetical protein